MPDLFRKNSQEYEDLNEKSTLRPKQVILKCGLQCNKTSDDMRETKITEFLWFLPRVA